MSSETQSNSAAQTSEKKERSYFFDTFRGLLIWMIPISHFTMVGGNFDKSSFGGVVYITINVFVMQAFVFLSGYFSKKPVRARETAFRTFLFQYILLVPFFYGVRYLINGTAALSWTDPPLALWYLIALFVYRFFLVDFIKSKYILQISIFLYLIGGLVPWLGEPLALGRMVSYFPFFILGYFCTKEHIAKIQSLKTWHCVILGIVLISINILLAYKCPIVEDFYLLRNPGAMYGIKWYIDILMRIVDFILPCGWIVLLLNILPKGKNYLTYVGMNTMAVYILHLIVRQLVKKYQLPEPDMAVYYICLFGLASLCVIVFSSPPISKGYNWIFDFLYEKVYLKLKTFVKWALGIETNRDKALKEANKNKTKSGGNKMELKMIQQDFAVCKIKDPSQINYSDEYCFVGKTDEELSLVCSADSVPEDVIACDSGWKAFRIEGVLDFSLIGILSKISTLLAENEVGIFAISTYNTDYILTKAEQFEKAISVLKQNGYEVK